MVCRHCKANVKRGMKRCPYCGEPLKDYRPALAGTLCAVLLIAIAALSVYYIRGNGRKQNPDTKNESSLSTDMNTGELTEATEPTAENTEEGPELTAESTTEPESESATEPETGPETGSGPDTERETREEPAGRDAQPVNDRWSGMSREDISETLEKEEFPKRMNYVDTLFEDEIPGFSLPERTGSRSRTGKPDVLYVREVLDGLESGDYEVQVFPGIMSSGAAAEFQVYRLPGLTEASAILYTEIGSSDVYTFIYHGGELRYAENFSRDGAAWFMNDYMTVLLDLQSLDAMTDYEIQNEMQYFILSDAERTEFAKKETLTLKLAYEVYERAVIERNYANVQLDLVLHDRAGNPVEFDAEEIGAELRVTSEFLDWDGLTVEAADFYYVEEAGWCADFYLPALSKPYTLTVTTKPAELTAVFSVDYNFETDGTDQYKSIGQIVIPTDLEPETTVPSTEPESETQPESTEPGGSTQDSGSAEGGSEPEPESGQGTEPGTESESSLESEPEPEPESNRGTEPVTEPENGRRTGSGR